jgi:hypothetical protein
MSDLRSWAAAAVVISLLIVPAAAPAGESHLSAALEAPTGAPASLPVVKRALSVAGTGRTARTTYVAPMSGFVSVRLGARRGDWDLRLTDAQTGRTLSASRSFGARELAQVWVQSGQRLAISARRVAGRSRTATARIRFFDAEPPASATPALVRVKGPNAHMLSTLEHAGFDVTHNVAAEHADVVVPDGDRLGLLERLNVPFDVVERDLNAAYVRHRQADARYAASVARSPLPTGRTGYRLPTDYQDELKQIVADHGDIARPVTIGSSYQGRPIEGVEIADEVHAKDDGRPVYFITALHHAREWPSAEIAMEFAWELVKGHGGGNAEISDLLSRERVVIVPISNPDGFFASRMTASDGMFPDPADSTGAPFGDTVEGVVLPFGGNLAYRRKNCNGPIPSFEGERDMPCYYQWGVDPNRNYGNGWGGKGAGSDPNTQSYRGDGQWSEPETQAVHEYSQRNPVTTFISIHNVAALVLRPPGKGDDGKAPDELPMKAIGDAMGHATGYKSQYSFQLYDTSGTTEDWNYAAAGTYGYTIEVGPVNGKFHMPYATGVVKEWVGPEGRGGMREALLIGARTAADPASHSVLEGTALPGTVLKVRKEFETKSSAVCTYSQGVIASSPPPTDCVAPGAVRTHDDHLEYETVVPASGAFSWHVTQSTRPFVGGRFIEGERTDSTETVNGPGLGATEETVVHEFDVAEENGTSELDLRLSFLAKPEDYDLRLEYVEADGSRTPVGTAYVVDGVLLWTAPGGGVNPNGLDEHIVVAQPKPGRYVATVTNVTGVTNDWTLTVATKGQKQGHAEETGAQESWTLTCERGGEEIARRDVVVERGERLALGAVCGDKPKKGKGKGKGKGKDKGKGKPTATGWH